MRKLRRSLQGRDLTRKLCPVVVLSSVTLSYVLEREHIYQSYIVLPIPCVHEVASMFVRLRRFSRVIAGQDYPVVRGSREETNQ